MKKMILACAGLIATSSPVSGQGVAIIGEGLQSCGNWTTARRDDLDASKTAWILGYLSGIGFSGSQLGLDPLRNTDGQAVLSWIDGFCRDHPVSNIAGAGAAFVQAFPRGR
jgi:hypothetical protein